MNHFHSAVCGDWEDLTVLGGDAEVDDGSTVAFQNPSWFPKIRKQTKLLFCEWCYWSQRKPTESWFLTQRNVGSTCVWVCPCLQWPAGCAHDWGQTSWHLCGCWKLSGQMTPGAVESSSVGPSWSYLRSRPLWSHSAAARRPSEAAHNLVRGGNTKLFITRPRASIKNMPLIAVVRHYQNKWPWQQMDTGDPKHTHTHTHTHIDMLALIGEFVKDESSRVILHSYQAAAGKHQV